VQDMPAGDRLGDDQRDGYEGDDRRQQLRSSGGTG
jgi:hypothetical protein